MARVTGDALAAPAAPPVIGHVPAFRRRRLTLLKRCAASPGVAVPLRIGGPAILLKRPEDIRHVFTTGAAAYEKSPRATGARARRVVGDSVFTAEGAEHRPRRRRVQPAFRHDSLQRLAGPLAQRIAQELGRWRAGEAIHPGVEAERIALAAMPLAVFGVSEEPAARAVAAGVRVRRAAMNRALHALLPLPARLPLAVRPSRRRAVSDLDRRVLTLAAERRERPGTDIISGLAASIDDDLAVRDEALGLAVTAYETVAQTVATAWGLLARNPRWWAVVRHEAAAPAVVAETLRLHPPTSLIARIARRDDTLPSGVHVPRGAKVLLSPYVVQRDPTLWPDPARFDPSRFSAGEPAGAHSYSYFPFGAGPRGCVGQGLARLEAAIVVSETAARFELAPGPRRTLAVRAA